MDDSKLTEAEKRYLNDLQRLPATKRSRLIGWALELIPSVGLFVYGVVSEKTWWMVLGFLSLLYFAVFRMYSQYRGFRLIHAIYEKRLSEQAETER